MKKSYLYLGLFTFTVALLPLKADAWLIPPTPITPTRDVAGDVGSAVQGVFAKLSTVYDSYNQKQAEVLDALKSAGKIIPFKIDTSVLHKEKGYPAIASVRTIEASEVADITDEESIVEAMDKLFYTYPSDVLKKFPKYPEAVKKAYRQKGMEFGNDSMIEMYIAVRDLESRMIKLKEEFDALSGCYVQGEENNNSTTCESASPNDEELGVWTNYYKLNAIYDSMLKITEELMAVKAQYEVAQAILAGITPRMPTDTEVNHTDEEEKTSYNDVFTYTQTTPMAFAQKTFGDFTVVPVSSNIAGVPTVTDAKPYEVKTQFTGTAKQFQSSAEANNAYQTLQLALTAHNLKRQLPEYKRGFEEYTKMKKLHEKAIEQLLKSEQCAVKFVNKYYSGPVEVWAGEGCNYTATAADR